MIADGVLLYFTVGYGDHQMTLTFDSYLGFVGIVLALLLYYFDLKKKLDHLSVKLDTVLIDREGVLTKEQAVDLVDLYLDAVDSHIELYLLRHARNDLPNLYRDRNFAAIGNEFERAYEHIVKRSLRKMISGFRLRGGQSVEDIISRISQQRIASSFSKVVDRLTEARQQETHLDAVIPEVLQTVRQINNAGKTLICAEIEKLYPKRAD